MSQKKGEVVIERVERELGQVTRRYILLVLVGEADPRPAPALLEALRGVSPSVTLRRRAPEGGSGEGGNGDQPALDPREGLLIGSGDDADHRTQLEFYAYGECPWFDRDGPPGSWKAIYEMVGDVALKDKEKDPRFVFLLAIARAVATLTGGTIFDLQEWKLTAAKE
jgi:hypothetical protein